jgi:NTE family protein
MESELERSATGEWPVDLVLEGGGVKGIALAGALAVLEERGYDPRSLAGASAGAIAATLYAAGYSAEELHHELARIPFQEFLDKGFEDRIPLIGKGVSVLFDHGVYEGTAFLDWMRGMLARKNVRTFGDLARGEGGQHRLQVIASDLTARRLLVLPGDASLFGLEPDDLELAWAVRMSMSIPVFFEPVPWSNASTGEEHVIVDGGMLSNFPVWLFDAEGEPRWPTFGLMLSEPNPREHAGARIPATEGSEGPVKGLISYLTSVIGTMLEANDRRYLEQADYARTIPIPTLGVGTTEFALSPERAEELYQSGRQAAVHFLDEVWDFEGYKAQFRRGTTLSRRRQVADAMRSASAEGSG